MRSPGENRVSPTHWFETTWQDVRYSFRSLRRQRGLTAVIVLTLALAIGANTAIFSLLDGLLLRALPVRDPQSLLLLHWTAKHRPEGFQSSSSYGDCQTRYSETDARSCSFSLPLYQEFQKQNHTLAELTAYGGSDAFNLTGHGPASIARLEWVAGNYFETLGLLPAAGRLLQPGDDSASAAVTVVLSYSYWQHEFGGERGIIGQTITLNHTPVTVVGVARPDFTGLAPGSNFDGWVPLAQQSRLDPFWSPDEAGPNTVWLVLVGRARPGVTPARAQAELDGLFRNALLHGTAPLAKAADNVQLQVLPAQTALNGDRSQYRQPLMILMWIVAAILAIACANIAGLLIGRAHARNKELALRRALGARGGRIARQLLTESLLLAFAGGAVGLGLAWASARALKAMLLGGAYFPQVLEVGLDARVLLFTLGATLVTGLLFGLAPAWRGARSDLTRSLKDATGNSSAATQRRRFRGLHLGNGLVVAQIAVCLVVLAGAGLLVRTLQNLRNVDPGFDMRNLLTFGLDASTLGYEGARVLTLNDRIQQQIAAVPGVRGVSYSNTPMVSGSLSETGFKLVPGANAPEVDSDWMPVGLHFFSTMGMKLLQGRDFEPRDFRPRDRRRDRKAPPPDLPPQPVIVNQEFVARYLKDGRVLGREFGYDKNGTRPQYVIVGVVSNAKYQSLRATIDPTTYSPLNSSFTSFEVRTAGDPMALLPAVAQAVHSVEVNLPLMRPSSQMQTIDRMLARERMVAELAGIFGGLALLLAAIGLYGLLAQEVTRRTREIGIRMALGAARAQVLRLVLGLGALLTALGLLLGLLGAWGATRYLGTMLYGVQPTDAITLAAVGAILLAVALAACLIPARRATMVDPMIALRYE
jgi:predicted permease